jgi:hypothetical protein
VPELGGSLDSRKHSSQKIDPSIHDPTLSRLSRSCRLLDLRLVTLHDFV